MPTVKPPAFFAEIVFLHVKLNTSRSMNLILVLANIKR